MLLLLEKMMLFECCIKCKVDCHSIFDISISVASTNQLNDLHKEQILKRRSVFKFLQNNSNKGFGSRSKVFFFKPVSFLCLIWKLLLNKSLSQNAVVHLSMEKEVTSDNYDLFDLWLGKWLRTFCLLLLLMLGFFLFFSEATKNLSFFLDAKVLMSCSTFFLDRIN